MAGVNEFSNHMRGRCKCGSQLPVSGPEFDIHQVIQWRMRVFASTRIRSCSYAV
jgi:hypothetical protein